MLCGTECVAVLMCCCTPQRHKALPQNARIMSHSYTPNGAMLLARRTVACMALRMWAPRCFDNLSKLTTFTNTRRNVQPERLCCVVQRLNAV